MTAALELPPSDVALAGARAALGRGAGLWPVSDDDLTALVVEVGAPAGTLVVDERVLRW